MTTRHIMVVKISPAWATVPSANLWRGPVDLHNLDQCAGDGYCAIHRTSGHKLNRAPIVLREDFHDRIDRECRHGNFHPDPDSVAWLIRQGRPPEDAGRHLAPTGGVRGCCGCCGPLKKTSAEVERDKETRWKLVQLRRSQAKRKKQQQQQQKQAAPPQRSGYYHYYVPTWSNAPIFVTNTNTASNAFGHWTVA